MTVPIDTPERLLEARQALGMTQRELAEALGITSTAIRHMERARRPIERRTDLAIRYLLAANRITRKLR